MRICLVTDDQPPHVSGVVTTQTRLTAGLRRRGHEVEVISPNAFPTLPCPTYPELRLAVFAKSGLAKRTREFRPEAIHLLTEGPLGWAGRRWCLDRGLPFTTSFTTKFPEYINLRSGLPVDWLYKLIVRFHRPAVRVTAATSSLKEELEGRGLNNVAPWSRGVETDLFRPGSKDIYDLPRPVMVYLGRVSVEKNIAAFLSLDLPGSKVVIGQGPALESLKLKYPEAHFLGRKTGPDLVRHLTGGDVLVFPSLTDTFGVVILEAMACGLPVAAYPVVGPKDVIIPGRTGWLDDDLGSAVKMALTMDPRDCRARALEFSWDRSLDQFLEVSARIPDSFWQN